MAFYGDGSTLDGVGATYGSYSVFGTSQYIDITGIASDTRQTTIFIHNWSPTASTYYFMQLGDSGGIENSGYSGTCWYQNGGSSGSYQNHHTTELRLPMGSASHRVSGRIVIRRQHDTSNVYVLDAYFGDSGSALMCGFAGYKQLSSTLTQVRLGMGTGGTDGGAYRVIQEV